MAPPGPRDQKPSDTLSFESPVLAQTVTVPPLRRLLADVSRRRCPEAGGNWRSPPPSAYQLVGTRAVGGWGLSITQDLFARGRSCVHGTLDAHRWDPSIHSPPSLSLALSAKGHSAVKRAASCVDVAPINLSLGRCTVQREACPCENETRD